MEIQEKMISGYCRAQNRANTVCCEYEERPEGLVLPLRIAISGAVSTSKPAFS